MRKPILSVLFIGCLIGAAWPRGAIATFHYQTQKVQANKTAKLQRLGQIVIKPFARLSQLEARDAQDKQITGVRRIEMRVAQGMMMATVASLVAYAIHLVL